MKVLLSFVSIALAVVVAACPAPKKGGEGEAAGEGEGAAAGEGEGEGAACATDALLGSLTIGSSYLLAGGQGLPDDIVSVGVGDLGTGSPELFGLTTDSHVVDLGAYPGTVPAIPPVMFDVVAAADQSLDRATAVFPSFLTVAGSKAFAGYTRTDQGGNIAGSDFVANSTSYNNAPGNFAGAFRSDGTAYFEGDGLGTTGGTALGVYFSGSQSIIITLGASAIASGNVAVAQSGVVVVGRFIDPDGVFADGKNELFAISSSKADAITAGQDTFDMENATPFYSGQDLNGAAWGVSAFHDGIAQIAVDANFAGIKVTHTALADDGTSVTASTPDDVVTGGSGACTTISFVASFNDDLLVGVQDAAGHRVIQLHAK